MNEKLAIKGHPTRGKEVIELLEMMGGNNSYDLNGLLSEHAYYFIGGPHDDKIYYGEYIFGNEEIYLFTLEKFLKKYPFKVGDKVLIPEYESEVRICKMRWCKFGYVEYLVYRSDDEEWYTVDELLEYNDEFLIDKELRMSLDDDDKLATEVTIGGIKIQPPYNHLIGKITEVDNGMLVEFVKKQPKKYPNSYEECCKVLKIPTDGGIALVGKWCMEDDYIPQHLEILRAFSKLIICRNAYWKIAGEEMGLGKPWKPDWSTEYERKYVIEVYCNNLRTNSQGYSNTILAFPTEEMRDAFYEDFKDLIEKCKVLL